jgi:hypothetical protein
MSEIDQSKLTGYITDSKAILIHPRNDANGNKFRRIHVIYEVSKPKNMITIKYHSAREYAGTVDQYEIFGQPKIVKVDNANCRVVTSYKKKTHTLLDPPLQYDTEKKLTPIQLAYTITLNDGMNDEVYSDAPMVEPIEIDPCDI